MRNHLKKNTLFHIASVFKIALVGLREGFVGVSILLIMGFLITPKAIVGPGVYRFVLLYIIIATLGNIVGGFLGDQNNNTFKSYIRRAALGGLTVSLILAIITVVDWCISSTKSPTIGLEGSLGYLLAERAILVSFAAFFVGFGDKLGQSILLAVNLLREGTPIRMKGWGSTLLFALLFGVVAVAQDHDHLEQALLRGFVTFGFFVVFLSLASIAGQANQENSEDGNE